MGGKGVKDIMPYYGWGTHCYIAPHIGLMGEYVKQDGKGSQKDEDKLQLGIQLVF